MSACPVCRSQNPVAAMRCWSCGSSLAEAIKPEDRPQEPVDRRDEPAERERREREERKRLEREERERLEREARVVEEPDSRETDALDDVTELHEPDDVVVERQPPAAAAPPTPSGLPVNLLTKFGLSIAVIFWLALLLGGRAWHDYLQRQASEQVLQQAKLMIQSATAMRTYTEQQIQPLVGVRRTADFHPQWVPFYAASQVFRILSTDYPDYTYKEAALNPMNLRDRAVDWEADIINYFRDNPGKTSLSGERESVTGRSLYLAHPITAEAGCLECHGAPSAAPPRMVALYGPDNGFGWRLHEVVGAQIVSVPVAVPRRFADSAFYGWLDSVTALGIVTLIVVGLLLVFLVTRRVGRITTATHDLAEGKSTKDVPVSGTDEIARLERAFNNLRKSLGGARK
ncbi:MAG: DUF3365 domain-containing protein [Vulcanimicrobiaceae bacterium]